MIRLRKLLALCIALAPCAAAAQQSNSIVLSIEPNILLANREFHPQNANPLHFRWNNSVGFGVNGGFQHNWPKWFLRGQFTIAGVSSTLRMDYAASGYNADHSLQMENTSNPYMLGVFTGVTALGGYRQAIGKRGSLDLAVGGHVNYFPIRHLGNSEQAAVDAQVSGFTFTYFDEVDKFSAFQFGSDVLLQYSMQFGRVRPFIGVQYRWNPGTVDGRFRSWPSEPYANSGTFTINRSYLGFQLGMMIGK